MVSSSGCAWTKRIRRSGNAPTGASAFTSPTLRGRACADLPVTLPVEYPELAAATSRFRSGEPRAATVGSDGARVVLLRSSGPEDAADSLWVFYVGDGPERLADPAAVPAVRSVPAGVVEPRPDPAGRRVAYVSDGALRGLDLATGDDLLVGGEDGNDRVTWGLADFIAAEEFHRFRGYWWSPD